jgi:hypothetical protein
MSNLTKNIVDKCLHSIEKAKALDKLNIFITNTFESALKQAEQSQQRNRKLKLIYLNLISSFNI